VEGAGHPYGSKYVLSPTGLLCYRRRRSGSGISREQAKQRYAGQWLAFLVTEETPTGELWGQLLAHNPDRRELHRELREKKVERAYITFAGPVVKPGYAVILGGGSGSTSPSS